MTADATDRPSGRDRFAAALRAAYPVPDPSVSEEQAERFLCDDIASLTQSDLAGELTVLRFFNYFVDSAWHLERAVLVEAALERLRRSRKR